MNNLLSQRRTFYIRSAYVALVVASLTIAGLAEQAATEAEWRSLFDGKSLQGWKVTEFGGQGDVTVENGRLVLDFGETLTGVTYTGKDLPASNYELLVEAQRLDGTDFFCGLTFPVRDAHLTLIVGGWGGALVGLSSLDGKDASENETQRIMSFRKQTWYRIRTQVTDARVRVWIDDEMVIDQAIDGRKLSLRPEVELSKPLGLATWQTRAAVGKIQIRDVPR
jgi:hypothetical protein